MAHECDGQTDGQTERPLAIVRCNSIRCLLIIIIIIIVIIGLVVTCVNSLSRVVMH